MLSEISIETDVKEIFDCAQEGYNSVTFDERGSIDYSSDTPSSRIRTLGELFCEYYLCCPNDITSLSDFLQKENIDKIISADDYQKIICGNAYFDADALEYFRLKLPFYISNKKLHRLNAAVALKNKTAEVIKCDIPSLLCDASKMRKEILAERAKRYHEYNIRYNLIHREEINEKHRQKYRDDPEYRQKVLIASAIRYHNLSPEMKEKMYAQQRKKYNTDEEFRKRSRQKCARRYAAQKKRMAEDPQYAAKIRKEQREAKRLQRARLKKNQSEKED